MSDELSGWQDLVVAVTISGDNVYVDGQPVEDADGFEDFDPFIDDPDPWEVAFAAVTRRFAAATHQPVRVVAWDGTTLVTTMLNPDGTTGEADPVVDGDPLVAAYAFRAAGVPGAAPRAVRPPAPAPVPRRRSLDPRLVRGLLTVLAVILVVAVISAAVWAAMGARDDDTPVTATSTTAAAVTSTPPATTATPSPSPTAPVLVGVTVVVNGGRRNVMVTVTRHDDRRGPMALSFSLASGTGSHQRVVRRQLSVRPGTTETLQVKDVGTGAWRWWLGGEGVAALHGWVKVLAAPTRTPTHSTTYVPTYSPTPTPTRSPTKNPSPTKDPSPTSTSSPTGPIDPESGSPTGPISH